MGICTKVRLIQSGLGHMRLFLENVQDETGYDLWEEFDKLSVEYVLRNCQCRDVTDIALLFAVWRARVANRCNYDLKRRDDNADI